MNPFLNRICVRWFAGLLAPCLAFSMAKAEDPAVNPNLRKERELMVTMEGGKEMKRTAPGGEILSKDGVLTLYPGDEVNLEFQEKNGKLAEPKVVAKVEHPERTITFKMAQHDEFVMMIRSTKIQKAVAMDCQHAGAGGNTLFRTNLEPTEKGLSQSDSWPASVWMLRLSKIEVSDESAAEIYKKKSAE